MNAEANNNSEEEEELDNEVLLKRLRGEFDAVVAKIEGKRAVLEARGDDVDAMLAEMEAKWEAVVAACAAEDAAFNAYLHALADVGEGGGS